MIDEEVIPIDRCNTPTAATYVARRASSARAIEPTSTSAMKSRTRAMGVLREDTALAI